MAEAPPKKLSAMRYLRDRMVRLVVGVILFFIGLAVYNSYKYFFWSHTQAVVISVEPVCIYAKKDGRRSKVEYLGCGADSGATASGLVADGYKLQPSKQALIKAEYEAGVRGTSYATLRPWWESAKTLRPGSVIQIRYSPGMPDEAELITGAERVPVVILGFFVGALLLACLIAFVTYEGDEQATSG